MPSAMPTAQPLFADLRLESTRDGSRKPFEEKFIRDVILAPARFPASTPMRATLSNVHRAKD
jgi:hypothetical protein